MNDALCDAYVERMAEFGKDVLRHQSRLFAASTDMGDVSYVVPSFHGAFAIPCEKSVAIHSAPFAGAAATDEAHDAAIQCAKGMAMLALSVLTDESLAQQARRDFEKIEDA